MRHLAVPEQRQEFRQLPFINQLPQQSAHEHAGFLAVAVSFDIHPAAIALAGYHLLRSPDQAPVIERRLPLAKGLLKAGDPAHGGADEQVERQGLLEAVVVLQTQRGEELDGKGIDRGGGDGLQL